MTPHWRAAFLLVATLNPLQAAPREMPTPPPPPMPQAQAITTFRGRTVEIPLRAIGRAPGQLKFLIRTRPKFGRLENLQLTGRKTARITYFHDEQNSAAFDSFTYAVQAIDSAVSAPGTVSIAISEEPPALSVVHALDFGKLWVGTSREEDLTIRNSGGGVLSGRIIVSEPWQVLGSADYRLARHEERIVRVVFAPSESGELTTRMLFSHDPRSTVTLSGEGAAPLEFNPPKEVALTLEKEKTTRTGTLRVLNRTPTDRIVELSLPEKVEGPDEVTVPAGGETSILLRTAPDFLGPLEASIQATSEGFVHHQPVRVFAVPALLRTEPDHLDFAKIPVRDPQSRPFTLRNEGGVAARLRVEVPPEIQILPDPGTAVLVPGESRTFEARLELTAPGPFQKSIQVDDPSIQPLTLPVTALGISPAARQGTAQRPAAPATPPLPTTETLSDTSPGEPAASFNSIPPVQKVDSHAVSKKSLELRWKKPAPNAVSTLLEYRQIEETNPNDLPIRWVKWEGASVRQEGNETVVLLSNLPPNRTWHLRIVSLDETGRRSRPSETIRLTTPPAPRPAWIRWLSVPAVIAVAAWILAFIRRSRRAEDAADAARLDKITKA